MAALGPAPASATTPSPCVKDDVFASREAIAEGLVVDGIASAAGGGVDCGADVSFFGVCKARSIGLVFGPAWGGAARGSRAASGGPLVAGLGFMLCRACSDDSCCGVSRFRSGAVFDRSAAGFSAVGFSLLCAARIVGRFRCQGYRKARRSDPVCCGWDLVELKAKRKVGE